MLRDADVVVGSARTIVLSLYATVRIALEFK